MNTYKFHDEYTLAETADQLGKKVLKLNLIPSFIVHHLPDSRQ
ncbi:hypothetical protein [Nostoc sp. PCC 7107]|nr:hypothetical protein [Nostoc sp. PCC 7107]AFY44678.1 hypothetical protein Nos7107_4127 [Nostoc sp. PCC 7107]